MERKLILEMDSYDRNILLNALNDLRTKQIREGLPTDPVDELMMKLYEAKQKCCPAN